MSVSKSLHRANLQELERLGYHHGDNSAPTEFAGLMGVKSNSSAFSELVGQFQEFVGLPVTGTVDKETQKALTNRTNAEGMPRMCSCADIVPNAMTTFTQNWPKIPIVMGRNFDSLPGLSRSETDEVFQACCDDWNRACGVDMSTGTYQAAHIRQTLHNHSGGTLADAVLANPPFNIGSHWQRYDSSGRQWSPSLGKKVAIHETGHTLKWFHTPANQGPSIMAPFVSDIEELTSWDIREAQKAYGPPLNNEPDPPPDPPKPGKGAVMTMSLPDGAAIRILGDNKSAIIVVRDGDPEVA